jgi:antitoxin CcdA
MADHDQDQNKRQTKDEAWLAESKRAIEDWNRYVESHGLPLAKYRSF